MTSFPVDELLAAPATEAGERANAIELRGVSKNFGDAVALHPLDLDIRDGEFFCLLGPSGCGKTTTLNIIGGFIAPSAGVVRIAGNDMTKRPPNRRPVQAPPETPLAEKSSAFDSWSSSEPCSHVMPIPASA